MTPLWISAGIELTDPQKLDQAIIELDRLRHHTVNEPGCLYFEVLRDQEHPTRFTLWECWTDPGALDSHFNTAHTLAYLKLDLTKVNYVERLTLLKTTGQEEAA